MRVLRPSESGCVICDGVCQVSRAHTNMTVTCDNSTPPRHMCCILCSVSPFDVPPPFEFISIYRTPTHRRRTRSKSNVIWQICRYGDVIWTRHPGTSAHRLDTQTRMCCIQTILLLLCIQCVALSTWSSGTRANFQFSSWARVQLTIKSIMHPPTTTRTAAVSKS